MRSIKCTNKVTNFSITFSEDQFAPFLLASVDGIYTAQNTVYTSDNTMTDGATYQGSSAKKRNILITAIDQPEYYRYNIEHRDVLYNLFRKGEAGELIYTEDETSRKIEYYTESIKRANKGSRAFSISLICPNPAFTDVTENNVQMANWISAFEFPHNFLAEGEEFGYRSPIRIINVVNDRAANNIGMTIMMRATGPVTNPSVTRVESDEHIKVGSEAKPFNMVRGDLLKITTGINNKHVYKISGGTTEEVNEYLTEESEFIQLMFGDNNIAYGADYGEGNLIVEINYAYEYEGA